MSTLDRLVCVCLGCVFMVACGGGDDAPQQNPTSPDSGNDTGALPEAAVDAPSTLPEASPDTAPQKNACGGTKELQYDGGAATPGAHCGVCNDGLLGCAGVDSLECQGATDSCLNDAAGDTMIADAASEDGAVDDAASEAESEAGAEEGGEDAADEDASEVGTQDASAPDAPGPDAPPDGPKNACGGYAELLYEGQPPVFGSLCGGCHDGTVACIGPDSVACVGANPSCLLTDGGIIEAGTDGSGPDADLNECGGKNLLTWLGKPAAVGQECGVCNDGQLQCDGQDKFLCQNATAKNACGVCGILPNAPGSSCAGTGEVWVCTTSGTLECMSPKPPPTGLSASYLTYGDYIRLNWTGAPNATGYVIRRNGTDIAQVLASKTTYDDSGPETLGQPAAPLNVAATTTYQDRVVVTWSPPPGSAQGALHSYTVLAVYGTILSVPSSPANGMRAACSDPAVTGYAIMRGSSPKLLLLPASQTSYEDWDAPAGVPGAPTNLSATVDRTDGVMLSWTASEPQPGPAVSYAVAAFRPGTPASPAAPVSGSRTGAPVLGYAVSRDGLTWQSVGSNATWLDTEAPAPVFQLGNPEATDSMVQGEVWVRASTATVKPTARTYQVRAQSMNGAGQSVSTQGSRGWVPPIAFQWQQSTADSDADYFDVTGATSERLVDPSLENSSEGRYYRFIASAQGMADRPSPAVRGAVRHFKTVVATHDHSCALGTDGKVVCWGDNKFGQAPPGPSTDGFKALSAGGVPGEQVTFTTAIGNDGRIVFWGYNSDGMATTPTGTYKAISAGGKHACAIRDDDRVVCWGNNFYSQAPTTASTDTFKALGSGDYHTCGIRMADDKVVCWGWNAYSQAPKAASLDSFKALSGGTRYTCGIRIDDKLVCWGGGGDPGSFIPPPGPSTETYTAVSAGLATVCAQRATGGMECWGPNDWGQAPPLTAGTSYTALACGTQYGCAIRADQKLVCWGLTASYVPVFSRLDTFKALSSGGFQQDQANCGIRSDDSVACWLQMAPPEGETFKSVSSSRSNFACGIRTDDKLVCWGQTYLNAPAGVSVDTYKMVAVGTEHTCAIRAIDDKVVCWGKNSYGHAPPGPSDDAYKTIAAGDITTCGIRADDKLVCWGYSASNGAPTSPTTEAYKSVSLGVSQTCGVGMDGLMQCWGTGALYPSIGAGIPFKDVDSQSNAVCGLRTDDKVMCWGIGYGQTAAGNVPKNYGFKPTLDTFLEVRGTVGIRSDGKLVSWTVNNNSNGVDTGLTQSQRFMLQLF